MVNKIFQVLIETKLPSSEVFAIQIPPIVDFSIYTASLKKSKS